MKISSMLTAAAFASLSAMGANAEEYQGVLKFQSSANRAEVQAQSVVAVNGVNPYAEAASAGVALLMVSAVDRAVVRAEAVAAAHAADPYAEGAFAGVAPLTASTVDRQAVRAHARTATLRTKDAM